MSARPEVRAEPMARLTDTIGDGDQGCLLASWCRNDSRFPGQLKVKTIICPRDQQEQADISDSDDVRSNQHRASDSTTNNGSNNMPKRLLPSTGRPRTDTGKRVGKSIWRSLDEIGGQFAEVERVDNLMSVWVSARPSKTFLTLD